MNERRSAVQEPVAWARPEDLIQDGYSHSFYVHQVAPGKGEFVPLYAAPVAPSDQAPAHTDHPMRHYDRTCPAHLVRRGLRPDGTYPLADDDEATPATPVPAAPTPRTDELCATAASNIILDERAMIYKLARQLERELAAAQADAAAAIREQAAQLERLRKVVEHIANNTNDNYAKQSLRKELEKSK